MGKRVLKGALAFRKPFLSGKILLSVPCGSFVGTFHCIKSYVRTTRLSICILYLNTLILSGASRDSLVGIATRYGLDGLGIESR